MTRLNAKQLRVSNPKKSEISKIKHRKIYIICDNIMDAFNVGSIFRLADAVGVAKIYLCGEMQTPPYHRISKAAVGTDKWIEWEKADNAANVINNLKYKINNLRVYAIEQGKGSKDFRKVDFKEPLAFVIGHETTGVSREAIKASDEMIEIPMFGINRSLNVLISLAIVLSKVIEKF